MTVTFLFKIGHTSSSLSVTKLLSQIAEELETISCGKRVTKQNYFFNLPGVCGVDNKCSNNSQRFFRLSTVPPLLSI